MGPDRFPELPGKIRGLTGTIFAAANTSATHAMPGVQIAGSYSESPSILAEVATQGASPIPRRYLKMIFKNIFGNSPEWPACEFTSNSDSMDKAYFKIFSTIFGNGSFYYVHHLEAAEQHPDN